MPENTKAPAA